MLALEIVQVKKHSTVEISLEVKTMVSTYAFYNYEEYFYEKLTKISKKDMYYIKQVGFLVESNLQLDSPSTYADEINQ